MPNKSMALKVELVFVVYMQESEEIEEQHRDLSYLTTKNENPPKIKINK